MKSKTRLERIARLAAATASCMLCAACYTTQTQVIRRPYVEDVKSKYVVQVPAKIVVGPVTANRSDWSRQQVADVMEMWLAANTKLQVHVRELADAGLGTEAENTGSAGAASFQRAPLVEEGVSLVASLHLAASGPETMATAKVFDFDGRILGVVQRKGAMPQLVPETMHALFAIEGVKNSQTFDEERERTKRVTNYREETRDVQVLNTGKTVLAVIGVAAIIVLGVAVQ